MPTPDLDAVVAAGRQAIADAHDLDALREAEQAHLSRRSPLGEVQRSLGGRDEAARRDLGRRVNQARTTLQAELAARREALEAERDQALLEAERVDVTLPGRVPPRGRSTIARTTDEIVDIFIGLGYRVAEGRRSRPTGTTSRPSTSPTTRPGPCRTASTSRRATGEAGELVLREPRRSRSGPCRPGRRRCTSSPPAAATGPTPPTPPVPVFNQVEVLAVDRGLTMADMKGTLLAFARAYFGEEREIRLRPSYFPFVEPGAEVDVSCFICGGTGELPDLPRRGLDRAARRRHGPQRARAGGYDPEEVSGFAAGTGIERPYMLRSAWPTCAP